MFECVDIIAHETTTMKVIYRNRKSVNAYRNGDKKKRVERKSRHTYNRQQQEKYKEKNREAICLHLEIKFSFSVALAMKKFFSCDNRKKKR